MTKYFYFAKLVKVVDGDTIDALIDVGFDIWVLILGNLEPETKKKK